MRNWLHVTVVLGCITLACVVGTSITSRAQVQRPAEQQDPDKIVIRKDEVPFDVVVRIRRGDQSRTSLFQILKFMKTASSRRSIPFDSFHQRSRARAQLLLTRRMIRLLVSRAQQPKRSMTVPKHLLAL